MSIGLIILAVIISIVGFLIFKAFTDMGSRKTEGILKSLARFIVNSVKTTICFPFRLLSRQSPYTKRSVSTKRLAKPVTWRYRIRR